MQYSIMKGVSLGVADGVGGWVESGVDPSLFSQALMYHAHRYSRAAWAGEPEIDPTMDYTDREQVEGWELTPYECLNLAYGGVLREKGVHAGKDTFLLKMSRNLTLHVFVSKGRAQLAFSHSMHHQGCCVRLSEYHSPIMA